MDCSSAYIRLPQPLKDNDHLLVSLYHLKLESYSCTKFPSVLTVMMLKETK